MRGQYRVWLSGLSVGTAEGTMLALLAPANTIAELNRIEIIGSASSSTRCTWRLRRVTSSPAFTANVTPKAVDQGNGIAATLTFATSWSTAPTTWDSEIVAGQFEAHGGRDLIASSLQEQIARIGAATASYYDLTAVASAALTNVALRLTFTE